MDEPSTRVRDFLSHLDMEMLHDILLEWCGNRHINLQSPDAQTAARELIRLFEDGVRGRSELQEALAAKSSQLATNLFVSDKAL